MKQETPKQHVELINDNIEAFDKSIKLFKQETLEQAAERLFPNKMEEYDIFLIGAKWQQERSYSEEEVYDLMDKREHYWVRYKNYYAQSYIPFDEWFEQIKKEIRL